jgi:Rrf2 family protein
MRALSAVIDIAINADGHTVSTNDLAARHRIAKRNLEPVLQSLARGGILKSARGPGGGYQLSRAASSINAFDVLDAIATQERFGDFDSLIASAVNQLEVVTLASLQGITVEMLARSASAGSSKRQNAHAPNAPPPLAGRARKISRLRRDTRRAARPPNYRKESANRP